MKSGQAETAPERRGRANPLRHWPRLARRIGGYAFALLVYLLIVGVFVLLTPRRQHDNTPSISYSSDLAELREKAPYTGYAPQGLPAAWRPISSRLTGAEGGGEPVSWHLGYLTPSGRYGALEESDERPGGPGGFVIRMTSEGQTEGVQPVAGGRWLRYVRAEKDQRSLVWRQPGVTVIVTGTASYAELAILAGSLRPMPDSGPAAGG